jgi:hypothetical protein
VRANEPSLSHGNEGSTCGQDGGAAVGARVGDGGTRLDANLPSRSLGRASGADCDAGENDEEEEGTDDGGAGHGISDGVGVGRVPVRGLNYIQFSGRAPSVSRGERVASFSVYAHLSQRLRSSDQCIDSFSHHDDDFSDRYKEDKQSYCEQRKNTEPGTSPHTEPQHHLDDDVSVCGGVDTTEDAADDTNDQSQGDVNGLEDGGDVSHIDLLEHDVSKRCKERARFSMKI